MLFKKKLYLLAILILIPFVLWRFWISHYPEGIPAYEWLLNGDGIRFKGAFFYWIFAERLAKLILGYWGLPLLLLGILVKPQQQEGWLFRWYGLAMLLYLIIFATGNVRHDYYQILIIPSIVIFVAKGIDYLTKTYEFPKILAIIIALMLLIFMEAFGWYQVRDFFNINHPEIVEAGKAVDESVPKKALVIAPYNGDTAFLYQTGRAGWPIIEGSIQDMINRGAHYYVSVNFDDQTNDLIKTAVQRVNKPEGYQLIKLTKKYVIIQLVPNTVLPKN
ncbi:MAG: hypothetical protein M1365_03040, partial [Actinobacteria bacterium]|nr:hypothetical protein [Actinomycetota bacterium]